MATPLIELFRGDTKRFSRTFVDAFGAPISITGWTILLTVNTEENPINTDNEIEVITGLIPVGTDGKAYFPPAGTTAIGSYFYDIQATDLTPEKKTYEKGVMTVTQDIGKS